MFKNLKLSHSLKIKNSKLKILFVLPLFFVLSSMFLSEVKAQSLSLSLWPPLLEVTLKPGKSITQVYKLTNEGETDLIITSQIVPFTPADEFGNVALKQTKNEINKAQDENLPPASSPSEATNWFSFQNADLQLGQNFLLKAGQSQQIVLSVKIPPQAKEDDYYLTLLFESQPENQSGDQSGAQAQAKIGTNILLTVSETGEPPKKAQIEQFSLANFQFSIFNFQLIDSFTKPQFLLRVRNTGRSFFKPMGTIITTGWLGQKFISDLLPENVLTNSVRVINCTSPESPDKVAPCQIKSNFLFGPYQAKVEFGLDKVAADYEKQITFLALPFKLIFSLLTIIFILSILKLRAKNS